MTGKYEYPPHLRAQRNEKRRQAYNANSEYRDKVRALNRANYERKRADALQQGEKNIQLALTDKIEIANKCVLRELFTFNYDSHGNLVRNADGTAKRTIIGMHYCANVGEIADVIGYSSNTVQRWVHDGLFPVPYYWGAKSDEETRAYKVYLYEHVVEISRLFNSHQVDTSNYYNKTHTELHSELMAIDLIKFNT